MTQQKFSLDSKPHLNATVLKNYCETRLANSKKLLKKVLDVKGKRTEENTLEVYNELFVELDGAASMASLMSATHPSEEVRNAAKLCEQDLSKFYTDLSLHRELYEAIKGVDVKQLDAYTKRLVKKTLEDFKRSGVDRDEKTRAKIKKISEELVKIGQDFDKNIIDDIRSIEVSSLKGLEGLPEDYIAAKTKDGFPAKITTRYPDSIPFMTYAKSKEYREKLAYVSKNRAYPTNEKLLKDLLKKRHELATLLGYKSWAEEVMEDKMIGKPKAAQKFIDEVAALAKKGSEGEFQDLLKIKKAEDKNAKTVADWERGYYENILKRQKFEVDAKEVREYFQYTKVKDGLLDLTEKLFSLKYVPVKNANKWHESVEVLDVLDKKSKKPLGRIYFDMHPRDGKYSHAAQFTLRSGIKGMQLPEGVLVCNFPDPAGGSAALLEHGDVVTFFHEFGHLLHNILGGHQKWIRYSGVATEWDFVEAPSQFFEEWAYEYDVLKKFASHFKTKKVISKSLVEKLKAADEFGKGLQARHQMFYAALSLKFHNENPDKLDLAASLKALQNKYSNFPYQEGTHFYASFGHLHGYSSNYYTYMWSEVIARDLLSAFKKKGMMNTTLALKYRKTILEPGGSKDAAELVKDFLGRPYKFKAFEEYLNKRVK